ncbi:MAG TPA: citrate synthase [Bryobacteraceae bacterium]|nr:citrate synthase [Bryobacteraceae bacterium]
MPADTLTITDNRTGKSYEVPIQDETIRATDLRKIKVDAEDFGLMTYDPAYMNTAACKSTITFIDGDKGILNYRGYPIEQLADDGSYLETAYLLWHGQLPNAEQLTAFTNEINANLALPENFSRLYDGFGRDAHPMSLLMTGFAGMASAYPDAKKVLDKENRTKQIYRGIAQAMTLGAWGYRYRKGLPMVAPRTDLSFAGNFLNMLFEKEADPRLVRAVDILFILHADHEQNCSTSTMRLVGSSQADPFSSLAAASAALYGPLHGGANEAVLKMLRHIGSVENIPGFIEKCKSGEGRLMGFGHRVYKNYDPRARIIKAAAEDVFAVTGKNPLLDVASELEKIALHDEYFIKRKLYPNVDFYSGLIYEALGFPAEMFTVLFAIPRVSGWLSQWEELMCDEDQKIGRPRQIYLGEGKRDYVPLADRK